MPQNYRATLESYVSVLRQTLQPGAKARESVIVTEHGGYRLDMRRATVDLDEFDQLVRSAERLEPSAALATLNQALQLTRGQPFEDEPYADWAESPRSTYQLRQVQALIDAGRLALLTGETSAALSLADRAIALNPLAEAAYQVQMTAYYSMWRQEEALEAFARCRRLLAEELGVDPINETVALHLAILRHEDVAALLPGAPEVFIEPAQAPEQQPQQAPQQLGLLGRDQELGQLTAAIQQSLQNQFKLVLITGSSGMGKTQLAEAVAATSTVPVGSNRCSDLESELPFLAISLALQPVLESMPGRATPLLEDLLQRAEARPFDEFARIRTLEQLAQVVRESSAFVLMLDDVHWADAETIASLSYLRRRCPQSPVTIVLTCDRSRLRREELRRLQPDLRIDLDVLPPDAVLPLGEEVYEATGGHPLFINSWLEARRSGRQESFTAAVRDRVVTECWDLGPQAYRLVTVASVLDQPFDITTLASLVGTRPDDIAEELERLEERDLLRVAGSSFAFRHPPIRAILQETMSPARRFLLQQQAQALAAGTPRRRATDLERRA
jgi:DNA-binding SARP family transcriptional activator